MLNLEQLKIFVSVCETGSFSATARRLGKAQSGISQSIANLEIDVDKPLFVREKVGASPTEHALTLLPFARQILRQSQALEEKITALNHDESLSLSIAIEEGLWNEGLIQTIARYMQAYPHTQLELTWSSTFDIEQMIEQGRVQLGVVYRDEALSKYRDRVFLGQHHFISVARPDHELANQADIDVATLMRHRHLVHRSIGKKELAFSSGLSESCWYLNEYHTLHYLIRQGAGWADLPAKMVMDDVKAGKLVRLDLAFEPNGNTLDVIALRSHHHQHGKIEQGLLAELKRFFAE